MSVFQYTDHNFYDEYINEMIEQEIEIERVVFFENKTYGEKCEYQFTALMAEDLAKEIDKHILLDMKNYSNEYLINKCETVIINNEINVNVQLQPKQQFITINLDIT